MANRASLREFQQDLARRLAVAVASDARNASFLAVDSAGEAWLLPLAEAGEVLPVPRLTPAPLTQPWFVGAANVRGNLYGAVDFGAFRGAAAATPGPASRLVLCGQQHGLRAGLLVDRVLGLRDAKHLKQADAADASGAAPQWEKARHVDAGGGRYRVLDVAALVKSSEFMNIAI